MACATLLLFLFSLIPAAPARAQKNYDWIIDATKRFFFQPKFTLGGIAAAGSYVFLSTGHSCTIGIITDSGFTTFADHPLPSGLGWMSAVDDSSIVGAIDSNMYLVTPTTARVIGTFPSLGSEGGTWSLAAARNRIAWTSYDRLADISRLVIARLSPDRTRLEQIDAMLISSWGCSILGFTGDRCVLRALRSIDWNAVMEFAVDRDTLRYLGQFNTEPEITVGATSDSTLALGYPYRYVWLDQVRVYRRIGDALMPEEVEGILPMSVARIVCSDSLLFVLYQEEYGATTPASIQVFRRDASRGVWSAIGTTTSAFPEYSWFAGFLAMSGEGCLSMDAGGISRVMVGSDTPAVTRDHWPVGGVRVNGVDTMGGRMLVATDRGIYVVDSLSTTELHIIDTIPFVAGTLVRLDDTTIIAGGRSIALLRLDGQGRLKIRDSVESPFAGPCMLSEAFQPDRAILGAPGEGVVVVKLSNDIMTLLDTIVSTVTGILRLTNHEGLLSTYDLFPADKGHPLHVDLDRGFTVTRLSPVLALPALGRVADTFLILEGNRFRTYQWDSVMMDLTPTTSPIVHIVDPNTSILRVALQHVWVGQSNGGATVVHRVEGGIVRSETGLSIPGPLTSRPCEWKGSIWVPRGHYGLMSLTPTPSDVRLDGNERTGRNTLSVAPNPARFEFKLEFPGSIGRRCVLTSLNGQRMATYVSPDGADSILTVRIDCSRWSPGTYTISILNDDGRIATWCLVAVVH